MSDFDEIINTEEEWRAPSEKEFEDKELLNWWLSDKACRVSLCPQMLAHFESLSSCVPQDQFVTRVDAMTSVFWCRRNDASLLVEREGWSDRGVLWSPKGNYLATFHPQGIKVRACTSGLVSLT